MMNYEFRTLFEVTFPHAYYDTGLVEGLVVQPSPSAVQTMSGLNFFFKNKPSGFIVLVQIRKQAYGKATTVSLDPGISLAFYLHVEDPTFYKVTEIPAAKGMILYANNLNLDLSVAPPSSTHSDEWQLLPSKSAIWHYDLVEAVEQAGFGYGGILQTLNTGGGVLVSCYYLKDLKGNVVWQSNSDVLRKLVIDCSDLPDGCYSLVVTLENKQTLPEYQFVYSNDTNLSNSSKKLAMYQWFPQSKSNIGLKSKLSSSKFNELLPVGKSYRVVFHNIASYWRYCIVTSDLQPSSLSIECDQVNGIGAHFGSGQLVKTPDGRDATGFTSKQTIPLKQSPEGKINLKVADNGENTPLPYADAGYEEEKKMTKTLQISKIYVYL